ncbi:transmembrane ascorbate-dependent reductase CYB561-like isoform X2 [Neocloeon triangulifer]|nr:transmembrane ascorbate-dependent reductase CYB561-like isoform X2 [Neocloeon triangulifer]XP_059487327.1 transmembrane ascorbate-dependent reductase CYB561-like isoform X2 [Neocloeon triangulifer]
MDSTIGTDPRDLEGFTFFYWLAQGLGVLLVVLVGIWTTHYRGGFAWSSDPKLEFNWHPMLMTIGMIFMYANGMMLFRYMRYHRKRQLKVFHATCHTLTFLVTVIALCAAFDSHNLAIPPIPNLYTLHSWIGLTAVILFCCQFVVGFSTFLFPGAKQSLRAALMPVHRYFGMLGFVLSIAAALMGLLEKAIFTSVPAYQRMEGEGLLMNFIGVVLVIFAAVVIYVVSNFGYRRIPMSEDETLLTTESQMG